MKKVFYVMICFLMLQSKNYTNEFVYQVLRYHNNPVERATNSTDPVDHGRYVPYYYQINNNNNMPMFIAFTLIVNDGTYGHLSVT